MASSRCTEYRIQKIIEGVINEKQQAVEKYEDAIAEYVHSHIRLSALIIDIIRGHGAYLLEEVTGEIFKINVGNMMPGSKAIVKIMYVTLLTSEGDALRFALPAITGKAIL